MDSERDIVGPIHHLAFDRLETIARFARWQFEREVDAADRPIEKRVLVVVEEMMLRRMPKDRFLSTNLGTSPTPVANEERN